MPLPRLRQYTDPDTGEIINVETTKEAKVRHRKSGLAQWRPTRGQINAADIWNKQEEAIKRSREREEKRKKIALRQAQKDAAARERQQEKLRKGEISIEDTWGKINASQIRLNQFFAPPQSEAVTSEPRISQSDTESKVGRQSPTANRVTLPTEGMLSPQRVATSQGHSENRGARPCHRVSVVSSPLGSSDSLANHPRCSQPVTGLKRKRVAVNVHLDEPMCDSPDSDATRIRRLVNTSPRQEPPLSGSIMQSAAVMPPPAHRNIRNNALATTTTTASSASDLDHVRSPLAEMTRAQINLRVTAEKPDPDAVSNTRMKIRSSSNGHNLCGYGKLSSQELNDTLDGLSSQDFVDDLEDHAKENKSPLSSQLQRRISGGGLEPSPDKGVTTAIKVQFHRSPIIPVEQLEGVSTLDENHDFVDTDVDDGLLLDLAATQRFQPALSACPVQTTSRPDRSDTLYNGTADHSHKAVVNQTRGVSAGDSFAVSAVDDDDWLECIHEFEHKKHENTSDNRSSLTNKSGPTNDDRLIRTQGVFQKGGRVLPWLKNPIDEMGTQNDDEIPSSAKTEELND